MKLSKYSVTELVANGYAVFRNGSLVVCGRSKEDAEAMVAKMEASERAAAAKEALCQVAPELLSALKDIAASYDANDSRGIAEGIEASRAAIAKAEGSK